MFNRRVHSGSIIILTTNTPSFKQRVGGLDPPTITADNQEVKNKLSATFYVQREKITGTTVFEPLYTLIIKWFFEIFYPISIQIRN